MFQKLSNSWELLKASFAVLQTDKELMLFPLISMIATAIISLSFIAPIFFSGSFEHFSTNNIGLSHYSVLFLFYVLMYAIVIYFNTALVGAAMKRLNGEDPTLSDGFRIATKNIGNILGYAVISATVGLILRLISERMGIIGKIFAFFSSLAWSLATFLVIPSFVVESIGPIDAIKRSSYLLKKTWGEQIAGVTGISFFFGILTFGLAVIIVPIVIYSFSHHLFFVGILIGAAFVLAMIFIGILSSTLNSIFIAALYRFASDGLESDFFDKQTLNNSLRYKR